MVLDSTIFYPQGGGQPADTGCITADGSNFKFIVQDVRSKDQIVISFASKLLSLSILGGFCDIGDFCYFVGRLVLVGLPLWSC